MNSKLLSLLLLLILFTVQIQAQQNWQGKGRKSGECRIMNNLNLSDSQVAKSKELKQKHYSEIANLSDELDKLRIDKRALLRDENLSRTNYIELEKKMTGVRDKIALLRAGYQMDIYEMLTDEQKQEFRNSPMGGRDGMGVRKYKRGHRQG